MSRVAPLGLRFLDLATGATSVTGLAVAAQSTGGAGGSILAQATPSGFYAFSHLPGLRRLEFGAGAGAYWSGIAEDDFREFSLTVDDGQRRFLPFVFTATGPFQGLFDLPCLPVGSIPLFSAPARPVPANLAVVRAELRSGQQPAAHAVLEVGLPGQLLGRGLADALGRVVVFFPYPAIPNVPPKPLVQRQWSVTLRTRFDPDLVHGEVPDLCTVLSQPVAALLALPMATLTYGQELFVR